MSYITQNKKLKLDPDINNLHKVLVNLELDNDDNNMEENLNYIITRLLRMCYGNSASYSEINDAIGVLSCVMMEYYRTIAAPINEQQKFDNGDIEVDLNGEKLVEIIVKKDY